MGVRILPRISACCLLALAIPSVALAQAAATSLSELRLLVRNGDSVSVVDPTGKTATGRIAELSTSSLRLLVDGHTREFTQNRISEIHQRRSDSLANGAIIGALAGAGVGITGVVVVTSKGCYGCSWDSPAIPVGVVGLYSAMGAGIGVGVDALIRRRTVIYSSAPMGRTTTRVSPTLRPDQKSVRVAIGS
jgi:hypothetical protein